MDEATVASFKKLDCNKELQEVLVVKQKRKVINRMIRFEISVTGVWKPEGVAVLELWICTNVAFRARMGNGL